MNSYRENVLAAIEASFVTPNPARVGTTVWNKVLNEPWDGRASEAKNVLSVLEGFETYTSTISPDKLDRSLEVELRCRAYISKGVDLRLGTNEVLADMEEIVALNDRWNNLAMDTDFVSNSVLRENTADRVAEVALFIIVKYRTRKANPRSL